MAKADTTINESLSDDEHKALDILLTAERNYYLLPIKQLSGAYCSIETHMDEDDDEYIYVTIKYGVQSDVRNTTTTVNDRINRSTMKWDEDDNQYAGQSND